MLEVKRLEHASQRSNHYTVLDNFILVTATNSPRLAVHLGNDRLVKLSNNGVCSRNASVFGEIPRNRIVTSPIGTIINFTGFTGKRGRLGVTGKCAELFWRIILILLVHTMI